MYKQFGQWRAPLCAVASVVALSGCSLPWGGDDEPAPEPIVEQVQPRGPSAATQQALSEARAAVAAGGGQAEASELLAQAEAAANDGDDLAAQRFARQAISRARDVNNGRFLAQAKQQLSVTKTYTNLNAEQYERLRAAENALVNNRGEAALQLLKELNAQLAAATASYTVVRGDSLWKIASYDEIYGNPYQWPLIYKANYRIIKNPDLIYVDQRLSIISHPTLRQVELAVDHANNRHSQRSRRAADREYLRKAGVSE